MRFRLSILLLFAFTFCFSQTDSSFHCLPIKSDSSISFEKFLAFTDPLPPRFFQPEYSYNKKRTLEVVGTETILSASSLIALHNVWYSEYPRTSFHFFNDNGEC